MIDDEYTTDSHLPPRCPPGRRMACVSEGSLCTAPACATEPLGRFRRMTDHDPRRQKPDAGAETEAAITEESASE